MALENTEAVVLKMFNWSESSRTVVFFSDRYGKLALVDRGGRKIASKRGRLQPFVRMQLTFYEGRKGGNGYVSDCDIKEAYELSGDGELGRLAYASAANELLYLLLPEEEPQETLYRLFCRFMKFLAASDRRVTPAVFLAFLMRMMSFLGYHPSLSYCAGCSRPLTPNGDKNPDQYRFSPERGGLVCPSCQKAGEYYIDLSLESLRLLVALQQASMDEAARLELPFGQASQLVDVLLKFLSYHSGLSAEIKSLAFLEKLKRTGLN